MYVNFLSCYTSTTLQTNTSGLSAIAELLVSIQMRERLASSRASAASFKFSLSQLSVELRTCMAQGSAPFCSFVVYRRLLQKYGKHLGITISSANLHTVDHRLCERI